MSPHRREFSAWVNSKVECLRAFIDQQIIKVTRGSYSGRTETDPFCNGTASSIPKRESLFRLGTQCIVPVIAYVKIKFAFTNIRDNTDVLPCTGFKIVNGLPRRAVVKPNNASVPVDVGASILFAKAVSRSDFEIEGSAAAFNVNPEFDRNNRIFGFL